ncbi:MAG: DUF2027 domain-containing protein [Bacteroidales bacterium]
MKFKVGDRVKFLNESGGGIVSKIIGPSLVNVSISDGFDIPYMTSELLKIEVEAPPNSPKHMFNEDFDVKLNSQPQTIYEEDERNLILINNSSKGQVAEGIYFAFVPQDQKWLITGLLDLYLVNHTPYDILYSLFIEKDKGGFTGFDYGSVNSSSMVLLDSLERYKINDWERGIVQVLFHRDKSQKVLSPVNTAFKLRLPRFYNESSYNESAIIEGRSMLVSISSLGSVQTMAESDKPEKEDTPNISVTRAMEVKPENIIDKHRTSPREAVVDLHIYELVENEHDLDNNEKLKIQINYFTSCLENAIANNLQKVIFIHGVGSGVLKTMIREILKDYPNLSRQDASMQQFGYGATEIIIR